MAYKDSSGFYVYVHRRATDGRVFYVGKGKGKRAYEIRNRSIYWNRIVARHGYTIEIVQDNMQEWWSFELERDLIAFYGRENLANFTDGGEGATGAKRSAETIAKHVAKHTGLKRSKETCIRISEALKASPNRRDISGDNNPAKRPDVRDSMRGPRPRISGKNNVMSNPIVKAKLIATMQTKQYKENMAASLREMWKDPEYVKKVMASRAIAMEKRKAKKSPN